MRRTILPVLLPSILLLPSTAFCQGSEDRPFVDVIDVRVVNLEVVVLDGKGHRVSGLGPEDFVLEVDKREIPIEFFSEVSHGVAVSNRPAGGTSSIPGLVSGKEVGTSYLVFVDELFTLAAERNRVLKAFAPEVWRLGQEDRMAVVAFNGRRVDMLTSWTQRPEDLELAFEDAMARHARGAQTDLETRGLETGLISRRDEETDLFDSIYASERLENNLERITRAVTSTLRGFAQPPGRKVMLLLAGGWPDSFRVSGDGGLDHSRGRRILQPIYETANLLGYTLYPVDVPGPRSLPGGGAGRSGLRNIDIADGAGDFPTLDELEIEAHTTFGVLAEETGGQAMLDGARLTAFDRVIEDTRSYYWLGFVPDWQGDDKNHDIRVEVLRPGFKVRSRESFQDLSREKEVSLRVESALVFGRLPDAKPLQVRFGKVDPRRRLMVPLTLVIPMDEVTMLPVKGGKRYEANLELRIAVLDEDGNHNDIDPIPVRLHGDRLPNPGEKAVYETTVRMRSKAHDIVVALHDPVSGTLLATTGTFQW